MEKNRSVLETFVAAGGAVAAAELEGYLTESERTVLGEQQRLSDDLYGLMGLVAAERDPDALLERLLRQAAQALQLSGALAFGVQGGHWHLGAVLGTFGQLGPRQLGQVQSEVVSQVSTLEDGAPLRPGWRAVPLRLDGELLGLLVLDEGQRSAEALPGRERFLHALALQGAAALGYARLAARLRHSEARYQRLMQESPTAIASGFLGGELTEVNDAYLELLGLTREEYERGAEGDRCREARAGSGHRDRRKARRAGVGDGREGGSFCGCGLGAREPGGALAGERAAFVGRRAPLRGL